ncbi:CDP-diacylglycerol--glycerol-3-phosphate 3-phosphatidyltransferase [Wolbachia endosymbiont of Cruorifilaria tuberocauda]|uniref:CDP-diacylglycerol--glycerol-3-phosphate 3-phosphatidyltransferase n=1 Tax=Wolbachia endosymbiont of Cruorifilaria tuberocauda TaxID=1812111 RepID=UPI00158CAA00|nr:CDP-diacylglycerol--glycerol-3-phosphate 3-phosphatidyltransferase [Wolbachia endosymbiont of Cruorifilaria tuberocauda]QKX01651.1 CDP-diacylglycerol--glycerol-3-phosphate 3-phosphatidyltransferase [Wolbachia endosymbiont of Cruorifilaria tuberocauda]
MLKKNLPNLLTISRALAIPAIILSFYIENKYANLITISIFMFACVTDFFDGYLARAWKVQSKFGKLFDPIADKLIVISTIIMLIYRHKINDFTIIPSVIIICREVLVSGLREFLIATNTSLPVSKVGKIKTFLQMVAVVALIVNDYEAAQCIGTVCLWIAAIITVWSGYNYVLTGIKQVS